MITNSGRLFVYGRLMMILTPKLISEYTQAVGLASTIKPDIEIDSEDPIGMMKQLETKCKEDEKELLDHLELAWGLISNAYWDSASVEWKSAAERWRDKYHELLKEDDNGKRYDENDRRGDPATGENAPCHD